MRINLLKNHKPMHRKRGFLRYLGPGLLVTVGFIDPGNWASNLAAGSQYGYNLLWVVTISTFILIILQHNAAQLGIVTSNSLSESASINLNPFLSRIILSTAFLASVSTEFAEILGGAVALEMLFKIPIKLGSILIFLLALWMLFTNSYNKLEKMIISFVSIVGISFLIELFLVKVNYEAVAIGSIKPAFPKNSMYLIMSILGSVVMPHNLFLHSEVIQSKKWNLKEETVIKKQFRYELMDTFYSMMIGWAINSAMIIVAAATFYIHNVKVTDLTQAEQMLRPIAGNFASLIFALSLLFAGISSTATAAMAGGSIFAGIFKEPYDVSKKCTKTGVLITLVLSTIIIFFIKDVFNGLVYSQMLLSVQLPITVFLLIYLTSLKRIMGKYANTGIENIFLWIIGIIVSILNIMLLYETVK